MGHKLKHMIIIGGGIAGISLGRELSKRGQQVTLLEAENQLAYHTSGRSAQQLILGYGPPAVRELTDVTVRMLTSQQQVLDQPVVWPSSFMMVGTEDQIEAEAFPGQLRQNRASLYDTVPELRPERFTAGSLDARSLRTRAAAMIDWLVDEADNMDIHLGEDLAAASYDNGLWTLATNKATYTTETVINAAGAWADPVAELSGIAPLGLTPLRRTAAILETDTPIAADRCMVLKVGGYYYRYEDESGVLASPQDAVPSIAEDAQPNEDDIVAMIDEIQADTTLNITGIRSSWTGLRTESSDGVPVVGFDRHPGFFWLAGQSGYGFQTSLGFAKLAADLLLDGSAGEWLSDNSVAALAPTRFA